MTPIKPYPILEDVPYESLTSVLGEQYIPYKLESSFDYINLAAKGMSANIITNFRDYFKISRNFAAELLNVSEPTIYRWVKENKVLNKNHSIQIFELTELFLFGADVFESKDNFFKWLSLPNAALGGLEPKQLLEVPGGISKVKDVLGRIQYGVFS